MAGAPLGVGIAALRAAPSTYSVARRSLPSADRAALYRGLVSMPVPMHSSAPTAVAAKAAKQDAGQHQQTQGV